MLSLHAIAGCKTRPGKNSCRIHDEARMDGYSLDRTNAFLHLELRCARYARKVKIEGANVGRRHG